MERLGYRPELDGLRGIAIILVFCFHLLGFPKGGAVGVDLFFVLSGFLITSLLMERDTPTKEFYGRRLRRLMPALAFMLGCYSAYLVIAGIRGRWPHVFFGATYTADWAKAFLFPFAGLGHLWSLGVEEKFYLLWPLLMKRRRVIAATIALIVAVIALRFVFALSGVNLERLYFSPETRIDQILVGCLAALLGLQVRAWVGWVGLVSIIGFAFMDVFALAPLAYASVVPLISLAALGVVLAPPSFLTFQPLVLLGLVSYSVYLWHNPIIEEVSHAVVPAILLTLVFSIGSYLLVERRFRLTHARPRKTAAIRTGDGRYGATGVLPAL